MEELFSLLALLWMIFMLGGVCIIATYIVWDGLKSIYKGDFL
jgi:hypothetical protein